MSYEQKKKARNRIVTESITHGAVIQTALRYKMPYEDALERLIRHRADLKEREQVLSEYMESEGIARGTAIARIERAFGTCCFITREKLKTLVIQKYKKRKTC